MIADRGELKKFVRGLQSIPALPGVLAKLDQLTKDDKASVGNIARVVSADQALAGKVLRLVNSPFYGFPGRVSTISNALVLVGINVVKGLILSSTIVELMERHVVGLWEHSMGAAVVANVIAKRLGLPDPDEISTAALLHDMGRVLIKLRLGNEYAGITMTVAEGTASTLEAERERLSTDHAEVGEWLAKSWLLPDKLVEPIAYHHDVERSLAHRASTSVVHIADTLVKAVGFGFSGDEFVSRIHPLAWQTLGFSDSLLIEVLTEVDERLVEARQFSLEVQSGQ